MNNLVERYLYQVGRYLPESERVDIQKELRSLIQDRLDDRPEDMDEEALTVEILRDLGSPLEIARSYGAEQYLIGPALYPAMSRVLRFGGYIIPLVIVIVNIILVLTGTEARLFQWLLSIGWNILQASFVFFGIVVIIFLFIQRSGIELPSEFKEKAWNPMDLPPTDEPGKVGVDISGSLAGAILMLMILVYFLKVGGLTLRLNLSDPGEVLAVPMGWMLVYVISQGVRVPLYLLVLIRSRWEILTRMTDSVIDLVGVVCVYVVVFLPIWINLVPGTTFSRIPIIGKSPLPISLLVGFLTIVDGLANVGKLINQRHFGGDLTSITVQTDG